MPDLQSVDRRILDILREDGRISNVELARRVGVSEKTVRQRIARLVSQAGLRFRAEIDGPDNATRVLFLINTSPGQRLAVADRMSAQRPVDTVRLTTGGYDIVVEARFDSDAAALEFFVREVEAGDGVERARSIHVIKSVSASASSRADGAFERFGAAAARLDTPEALLDLACEAAGARMGTNRVFAGMMASQLDPDRGEPPFNPCVRWRGLSSRYIDAIFHSDHSPIQASRGQHLFVSDARTDPLFAPILDLVLAEGFRSFLSLPIHHNDEYLGHLNLYYNTVVPFDTERVAQGQELADAVGTHLRRVLGTSTPRAGD
jgi:DNA-binding Lrp family transcriptional regulator